MYGTVRSFLLRIRCELSERFSLGKGWREANRGDKETQDCLTGTGMVFFWKEKVTTPHGSVSSNFLTRSTLLIGIDQYWSNQKGRTQTFSYSLFFFSYYIYSLQGKTTSPFSPLEHGKSSKFWRLRKTPKQCKSFLNSSTHFFCFMISLLAYLILFPNFLVSLPTTSFTLFYWVLKDIKNCLFVYFYYIFGPSCTADEVPCLL